MSSLLNVFSDSIQFLRVLEANVWNLGGKREEHVEIINLHGWLLKMATMRKVNVCSSESKNGRITVSFACVYHYCSYLGLPFPPEPNLSAPVFMATFFFKQPMKYCFSLSYILFHALPTSIYPPFFFWPLEMPFYFILCFDSVTPLHGLIVVFVATEQRTPCRSASLGQNHVTVPGQGAEGCSWLILCLWFVL